MKRMKVDCACCVPERCLHRRTALKLGESPAAKMPDR